MSDLESQAGAMDGIENHPYGFMLLRLVRLIKLARGRLVDLEARVSRLEGK